MKRVTEDEKQAAQRARAFLTERIKPGDTIYTLVRHHTRTGSRRSISLFIARNSEVVDITWAVAAIRRMRFDPDHGGVVTTGYGDDMVHGLAMALFCPDEYDHEAANSLKHWKL